MLVLGFLSSSLDLFPLVAAAPSQPEITEDTPFNKEIVEETVGKVGTMYPTIVADMASFAATPDSALAPSRTAEMTAYATTLADRLDTFATTMQAEMDELTITPSAPTGLTATADDLVTLDWNDNKETNLVSYIVYRTTTSGGPYELRAWGLTASYYSDPSVVSGTTYYYVVTVINESSMESEYSNEAAASPVGGA